mgnify:FL=1
MGYMRPFVMGVPWQLYLSMYYPIIWPVTVFVMLTSPPPLCGNLARCIPIITYNLYNSSLFEQEQTVTGRKFGMRYRGISGISKRLRLFFSSLNRYRAGGNFRGLHPTGRFSGKERPGCDRSDSGAVPGSRMSD